MTSSTPNNIPIIPYCPPRVMALGSSLVATTSSSSLQSAEITKKRRYDRVVKMKKLRAKKKMNYWSPSSPDASVSDSETEKVLIKAPLTRQERNRESAKESREKKNREIDHLSNQVQNLEEENEKLKTFLLNLPPSIAKQLQSSTQFSSLEFLA